jgi:UDP-N-acetylmuramate: L-alanyl-gamma-D-glutamyl-meso-diaminopimelate ligase
MNIHILGIAGAMTTPLAITLKKQGHHITGSDQEKIYPPFSTLLNDNNISINKPIDNIDLAIIGSSFRSFSRCLNEYKQIKEARIPYISATKYLADNLIKSESILVTGSYGKTTITALLAHIYPDSNYFFGGQPVDGSPSLQFSKSPISIIEADESINGLDVQAKYLYYPVKYLILTSANWEHKESYPTANDNFLSYQKLIEKIPTDGALIYNPHDKDIQKLLPYCHAPAIPYVSRHFDTQLIGQHNQENIAAAYTLCQYLKKNDSEILPAIKTFSGIHRRLEVVYNHHIIAIDDFAQSADRVFSALIAIRYTYPHHRIIVYFEPHASFLQKFESLKNFNKITKLVDTFVLGKITYSTNKYQRVTSSKWQNIIGNKLIYIPLDREIISFLTTNLHPGDILVHFSSGGLSGLNILKTVYNNIHL